MSLGHPVDANVHKWKDIYRRGMIWLLHSTGCHASFHIPVSDQQYKSQEVEDRKVLPLSEHQVFLSPTTTETLCKSEELTEKAAWSVAQDSPALLLW
ncbi:hypothetical protein PHYPO_G00181250 [Pangasianodon hypophthalmus]|uniref:Uncharacterized protein n=1 Tax=Pangasianodon hypophthalmus TaxID=310915 RepID=A0A5N5PRU6_PANHP|nr:hypothetical protein PHYPO_G00181250 [Pangasianodon hypophthalmus]